MAAEFQQLSFVSRLKRLLPGGADSLRSKFEERSRKFRQFFSIEGEVVIELTDSARDKEIARYLNQRLYGFRLVSGAAVLALPTDPADYFKGRPKQALRTNRSRANAMGLQVRRVTPEEFNILAKRSITSSQPPALLDKLINEPAKSYMETWAGLTPEGEAIAFARFAVGTSCVRIKYFAATHDRELSLIRWKMAGDIFESFITRGIRHIVAGSVLEPSNGLVYYQERLGFVHRRIVVRQRVESTVAVTAT